MVIAALAGAVVFQLALVASYTATFARPVLNDVTSGLVGPSPTPAGDVGAVSDNVVRYQPVSDAATARQEVSDGRLPAALIVAGRPPYDASVHGGIGGIVVIGQLGLQLSAESERPSAN